MFPAAWARDAMGLQTVPPSTLLTEVAVDEQHRRVAPPAGARASHATTGARLQDAVSTAVRAAMFVGGVGARPMAASAQVTLGFADGAATPLAVPDPTRHPQIGGIDRPRRDGDESLAATFVDFGELG